MLQQNMFNMVSFLLAIAHYLYSIEVSDLDRLEINVVVEQLLFNTNSEASYSIIIFMIPEEFLTIVNDYHHVEQKLIVWMLRRVVNSV